MSFDGQTASTLDVVDASFEAPRRSSQRRMPPRATPASTVDEDLIPETPMQASTSTIEPMKVVLETEPEDPNAQRAIVLAPVPLEVEDALEKLFLFTSSPWWLSVVRATRNAIVVDIQLI